MKTRMDWKKSSIPQDQFKSVLFHLTKNKHQNIVYQVLLALEVEAAKESGLNIIEKYGLLAKPEYFEAFVALPC